MSEVYGIPADVCHQFGAAGGRRGRMSDCQFGSLYEDSGGGISKCSNDSHCSGCSAYVVRHVGSNGYQFHQVKVVASVGAAFWQYYLKVYACGGQRSWSSCAPLLVKETVACFYPELLKVFTFSDASFVTEKNKVDCVFAACTLSGLVRQLLAERFGVDDRTLVSQLWSQKMLYNQVSLSVVGLQPSLDGLCYLTLFSFEQWFDCYTVLGFYPTWLLVKCRLNLDEQIAVWYLLVDGVCHVSSQRFGGASLYCGSVGDLEVDSSCLVGGLPPYLDLDASQYDRSLSASAIDSSRVSSSRRAYCYGCRKLVTGPQHTLRCTFEQLELPDQIVFYGRIGNPTWRDLLELVSFELGVELSEYASVPFLAGRFGWDLSYMHFDRDASVHLSLEQRRVFVTSVLAVSGLYRLSLLCHTPVTVTEQFVKFALRSQIVHPPQCFRHPVEYSSVLDGYTYLSCFQSCDWPLIVEEFGTYPRCGDVLSHSRIISDAELYYFVYDGKCHISDVYLPHFQFYSGLVSGFPCNVDFLLA